MKKQTNRPVRRQAEIRAFGTAAILLVVSFLVLFHIIYPVKFGNYGGKHMWLAGSTVKFINIWLQDGLLQDRFTFYESFRSVEFATAADRTPYVSYPTLMAVFPFLAAKLMGLSHIGLSFLKHFAIVCYAAEMLLFAALIQLVLSDLKVGTPRVRAVMAFFTSLFWVLIPGNLWYQINVFWVDQAVIFWIHLYLFLEYLHLRGGFADRKRQILLSAGRTVVIFCGMLTDYYFWIFIFLAFVLRMIFLICRKREFKIILREACVYVLPVAAALGAFLWQLTHVAGWQEQLAAKFLERTGTESENNVLVDIFLNFARTQADFSAHRAALLALLIAAACILSALAWKREGVSKKSLEESASYAIILLGLISPAAQILFLKNHSAVHEYAIVKVSWIVAASILLLALGLAAYRRKSGARPQLTEKRLLTSFLISVLLFLWLTNAPFNIRNFLDERDWDKQYPLAEYLYENAQYQDVYYTFTTPVKKNPPEQLAIAQKEVHLISSPEEIRTLYPDLPEEAEKYLVIQKDYIVEDPDLPITTEEGLAEVRKWEEELLSNAEIVWEDDSCLIAALPEDV